MRQRGQIRILVFAALFGLASCTSAAPEIPDSESPAPTVSPSVSPSEDQENPGEEAPTPEPLPLPDYPEDLTAEDTAENAILAAEYFLELMNYIQSTGDVAPFEAVAAESCESCDRYVNKVEALYKEGGFSVGNYTQMRGAWVGRTNDGLAWEVHSDWEVSAGSRYEATRDEVVKLDGARLEGRRIGVQSINGEWRVLALAKALST